MTRKVLATTALATLLAASAAGAEQYVVQIGAPYEGAATGLLDTLRISEIDAFDTADGRHFVVIDAPNEAYVEAFFLAINVTPSALHTVGGDWTGPALSAVPMETRWLFLSEANCGFCS